MIELTDTHCHIHEILSHEAGKQPVNDVWKKAGIADPDKVIAEAADEGVRRLVCVGTSLADSRLAISFVADRNNTWASIGIHPHEADEYAADENLLRQFGELATKPKVVAIGEVGLDYYYLHSDKAAQEKILRYQLDVAVKHHLPVILHIRNAFDDFWKIFDEYKDLRGIVHSFSATEKELREALERGLYIGLNGIMTFTKDDNQLAAAKLVPLEKLVLETDAPFLTPVPFRGTICEPKHVRTTAEFLSHIRGESLERLARATTDNARTVLAL